MKRKLSTLMIGSMLLFPTVVGAESHTSASTDLKVNSTANVEAGVLPGDAMYSLDQAFEKMQLLLTFKSDAKAKLYAELSEERMAELMALTPEARANFTENLLLQYRSNLDAAIASLEQAKAEGSTGVEATSQILDDSATYGQSSLALIEKWKAEAKAGGNAKVNGKGNTSVKANAAAGNKAEESAASSADEQQTADVITKAKVTARVVSSLDAKVIEDLRAKGLGYGQIALAASLTEKSGKSLDEIVTLMNEGKGLGEIALTLGIHPGSLKGKVVSKISSKTGATGKVHTETSAKINADTSVETNIDGTGQSKGKAKVNSKVNSKAELHIGGIGSIQTGSSDDTDSSISIGIKNE